MVLSQLRHPSSGIGDLHEDWIIYQMTLPTIEQRARLLLHSGWDLRDEGLTDEQIVSQLQSDGVPEEIAGGVPAMVDEAMKSSTQDQTQRDQIVRGVSEAVESEDFEAVQDALLKATDDDRTLHKAYVVLSNLLVGDSHEIGTAAAFGLSCLPGIGDWPLIQALESEDENLRFRAAFALGKLGADAQNALTALQELVSDPDDYVRHAVDEAIRQIQSASKPWWKFW